MNGMMKTAKAQGSGALDAFQLMNRQQKREFYWNSWLVNRSEALWSVKQTIARTQSDTSGQIQDWVSGLTVLRLNDVPESWSDAQKMKVLKGFVAKCQTRPPSNGVLDGETDAAMIAFLTEYYYTHTMHRELRNTTEQKLEASVEAEADAVACDGFANLAGASSSSGLGPGVAASGRRAGPPEPKRPKAVIAEWLQAWQQQQAACTKAHRSMNAKKAEAEQALLRLAAAPDHDKVAGAYTSELEQHLVTFGEQTQKVLRGLATHGKSPGDSTAAAAQSAALASLVLEAEAHGKSFGKFLARVQAHIAERGL